MAVLLQVNMDFGALLRAPVGKKIIVHGCALIATCILISLFYGSVVVGGPVLYGLGFATYGGFGYIALGLAVFFVIALRETLSELQITPKLAPLGIFLGLVFAAAFWSAVRYLNADPALVYLHPLSIGVPMHLLFWIGFGLLAYGFFGRDFIHSFAVQFRKPLLLCLLLGAALYASMNLVLRAWPVLSFGVSRLVYWLTIVFPGDSVLIPPMTLRVQEFGVLIGEACSGVFSIFLFSALFGMLIALDWRKTIAWRAVVLFIFAMVGLFLVNVLRVYLIVLVGALYDPELAVGLFHSYVGSVLFLIFFVLFIWYFADWMHKPTEAPVGKNTPSGPVELVAAEPALEKDPAKRTKRTKRTSPNKVKKGRRKPSKK